VLEERGNRGKPFELWEGVDWELTPTFVSFLSLQPVEER
jgi:hypothetical protein